MSRIPYHISDVVKDLGIKYHPCLYEMYSFEDIDAAHDWVNRDGAPRDECFFSVTGEPYTYGRGPGERTYYPIPFTPLIEEIRQRLKKEAGVEYEVCFSNRYDSKLKHLGWHADDSDSIDHDYGIVVISFGHPREIWFRENGAKGMESIHKQTLSNGSILMMPPGFQQTHQHRIPKHTSDCGARISLTFRKLK